MTFNSRPYIGRCLEALAHSTLPPAATVIIDNASWDGTADHVAQAFAWVTVVRRPLNDGFAAGANAGIQWCLARGHDVLLLNPDAFVEPGALSALTAASARHPRAVIGGWVVRDDGEASVPAGGAHISWWRGRTAERVRPSSGARRDAVEDDEPAGALCGACLLLPQRAIAEVGLLAEEYLLYFEDTDFCVRAATAGWELWRTRRAVVRHQEGAATGGPGAPLAMYYFVRNRHRFVRRFRAGAPVYRAFLAYEATDVAARMAWAFLSGQSALGRAIWRGWNAGRARPALMRAGARARP